MARVRSLSGKSDFRITYEKGVKRVGRLLVVYMMVTDEDQMAVVASKKIGDAVRRNRAKRLLREALRREVFADADQVRRIRNRIHPTRNPKASGAEGLRIVAIARAGIRSASCREVCEDLHRILS